MTTAARNSVTGVTPEASTAPTSCRLSRWDDSSSSLTEPAEIDNAMQTIRFRSGREVGGGGSIGRGEVCIGSHRVHEVVRRIAPIECRHHLVGVEDIAAPYLHRVAPWPVVEFARRSRQTHDIVPGGEQLGYEPAPDISGSSCDSNSHQHLYGPRKLLDET